MCEIVQISEQEIFGHYNDTNTSKNTENEFLKSQKCHVKEISIFCLLIEIIILIGMSCLYIPPFATSTFPTILHFDPQNCSDMTKFCWNMTKLTKF